MRFLSNFGCKIIFMCSVYFWIQLIVRKHWSRDLFMQVAICLVNYLKSTPI